MMATLASLTAADLEQHERLGIPADLLERAQVRRVDDREGRELLGLNGKPGQFAGIAYPYISPTTGYQNTSRLRLDHPQLKGDGTPDGKYRTPYGDNRHLYFAPGARELLAETSVMVVIVESEKATLAITAAAARAGRRVLVVGCGGCYGWRGRIGKSEDESGARVDVKGPLSDFHPIAWADRQAVILFDARPNELVMAARRALAKEVRSRGADVRHAHLPDDNCRVNGPDDLIAAQGGGALWRVIDGALPDDLVRQKNGNIIANNLQNIRLALSNLGTITTHNEFTDAALVDGRPFNDAALDQLWVRIDDEFRFRPSKETLRTLICVESRSRSYHPVRDYLASLVWEGTPRLDDWLVRYGGAEASAYVRAVSRIVLIAAVRRVRQPGCKFDELVVMESPQGTNKSSTLRALCADETWFSDDLPLGVDSKQIIERTSGKWIIEAAEMYGNRGKEAEALKAFLSRQVDGPVRLAYARLPVEVPRQFVLIGTTNSHIYLKDSTGGRRFWPVRVLSFDVDALRRDRDQLWAEAAFREGQDEGIRLAPELWAAAGEEQECRLLADPWEETLEPLFENAIEIGGKMMVAVADIWKRLDLKANQQDNRHAARVAMIAQRKGYCRKVRPYDDAGRKLCWHWIRDTEEEQ